MGTTQEKIYLKAAFTDVWKRYQEKVKACRRKLSVRNVHGLRIRTQKLEALLKVTLTMVDGRKSKRLIDQARRVRKILGPVRDLQLVSKSAQGKQKDFAIYVSQRKLKMEKKASLRLNQWRVKDQKRNWSSRLIQELDHAQSRYSVTQLHRLARNQYQTTYDRFRLALTQVRPQQVKSLHEVRKLEKQLRYQTEAISNLFGTKPRHLKKLKAIQEKVGKIHDQSVWTQMVKDWNEVQRRDSASWEN